MINPIDIALTRIKSTIPPEILEFAFQKRNQYEEVFPIDEMLLIKVIRARCIKDMSIYGGRHKKIVLRREFMEKLERNKDDLYLHTGGFSLFRIPPEEREGLPISEVMSVEYFGPYGNYLPNAPGYSFSPTITTIGAAVLDSHTFRQAPPVPRAILLSGDLVKLMTSQWTNIRWVLNCRLSYDENLTNLNTSAIEPFADLCVYATQAYIYTNVVISLDKAFIQGGYQIGQFKNIIDSYADANQHYNEQLQQVVGGTMLDPERLEMLLPYMV